MERVGRSSKEGFYQADLLAHHLDLTDEACTTEPRP